jgi:hypothetical protein
MRPLVVRFPRGLWTGDFRLVVIVVDGHLNQLKPFGDYFWENLLRAELKSMSRDAKEREREVQADLSASRSLASSLPVGALARGLLRLTVHEDQNWRRWGHAD